MESDLLIIGGGINGVGIALDAAGRGLTVVLCEKDDLGNHTSSASSKLVHGGLRYLEQMELKLVHEALREREILLHKAPHLVRPITFILPHDAHLRPIWMIRLGLYFYDYLSRRKQLKRSKKLNLLKIFEGTPLKKKFKTGFSYMDCQVDDSRLVISNAIGAKEKGSTIFTRTICSSAVREKHYWRVNLYDQFNQTKRVIFAKAIINASGPWVKQVTDIITKTSSTSRLRLVKGSHIVVPKLYNGNHAYILQNLDRRVIFAIPYKNVFTLIGTTDVSFEGDPNNVNISDKEINYLFDCINYYFLKSLSKEVIKWTFAGVRALFDDQAEKAQKVTRDYHLELNDQNGRLPIISIFGGKLTTYRSLAEQVLLKLRPYFPNMGRPWTSNSILPGGELKASNFEDFLLKMEKKYPWLPKTILVRYADNYGSLIDILLENVNSIKDLGIYFGGGLYEKEVRYLLKHEWAKTTEDIIWRRTKLGLTLSKTEVKRLEEFLIFYHK